MNVESEADRADRERRRIEEEEERRRTFEKESALLLAVEKARVEEEQRLAREKERLEAPRRYAASLGNYPHVYYFDTKGDFQELGKEGERTFPKKEPLKKRVKVTREEWVHGPNADRLLEEGESELATVTRYVWKCV